MIHYFEELTSSNDEAAAAVYAEGDVVWAERQTAGRGQRGHRWESEGGKNVTFTLVLEPRFLAAERQFLLSEAVTLGIADCLAEYGIVAKVKWTNDIYIGDRKVAGMLIEHRLNGGRICRTLVGIGVNVNNLISDYPEDIRGIVTTLREECGRTLDRLSLLKKIIVNVIEYQKKDYIDEYRRRCFILGRKITVNKFSTIREAYARDIDERARLVVEYDDGTTETLSSAEVTLHNS